MSETQKSEFNMKRAGAIGAGIVAGTLLVGSTVGNAVNQQEREDAAAEEVAKDEAYHGSIEAAVNAAYDRQSVVGEINVVQGTRLIDEAEAVLKNSLGDEVYKENRGHLYDYLLDSARLLNPQPNDTMYVVEVDLDQNSENGAEYIVTNGSGGIIEEPSDSPIPAPTTH